jgi:exodeoxyribonuclease V beta subunit
MAQNEILSENLRLLYVALTRAKERCYLAWGRIRTAETSALAYLLHCQPDSKSLAPNEDLTLLTKTQFGAKTNSELIDDLNRLAQRSQGTLRVDPLPVPSNREDEAGRQPEAQVPLSARKFNGSIDRSWRIASFTFLVSSGIPDIDLPDRDLAAKAFEPVWITTSDEPAPAEPLEDDSLFSFPKGTRAGIFFHDVLESHDFATENTDHLSQLVASKLDQYGFDRKWQAPVCRSLEGLFALPLRPDRPQLVLSSVQMADRVNEMEFYFPLNLLSSRSLTKLFQGPGRTERLKNFSAHLKKLEFASTRGLMKGYIDLVFQHQQRFYLVDWKSNYLGPGYTDYDQRALGETMQAEFYILQYHLYTLALHQYLRQRKPDYRYEKDFGGVFYVFLRGVDPVRGPQTGIYYDLPDFEFIHDLAKTMITGYV